MPTDVLGLPVQPGRLLVVDWVPPRAERTEGLMMVFDGGVLTPSQTEQIRLPAGELRSWAWCTEQQAGERLSGLLARRISAAVRARAEGTVVYLENGFSWFDRPRAWSGSAAGSAAEPNKSYRVDESHTRFR
jgi:8-oxo-dGTP diphosphatase